MAFHVASLVEKELSENNSLKRVPNIGILGFTFKEDCPDTRNTKVHDLYQSLNSKGYNVYVSDPFADKDEVKTEYGIDLVEFNDLRELDVVIVAVAHQAFKGLEKKEIDAMLNQNPHKFLFDLKSIFHPSKIDDTIKYLSL